jgi:GWxTD domain-containing protein
MKKYFTFLIAFLLPAIVFSQTPKLVQAGLFYSTFDSPADGPYIETYLSVVGNSLNYASDGNGNFRGKVEITMIFSRNDTIVNFDKYEFETPQVTDTSNIKVNFLDQQRYSLPNGVYEFDINIKDMLNEASAFSAKQTIEVSFPDNELNISGIMLIERFENSSESSLISKSGYDLFPFIFNFLPASTNKLTFYTEMYNTSKVFGEEGRFLVTYFVETYESSKKLDKFTGFKREVSKPVNVLFANFDVTDLPSGNYNLVVEVRNRENEVVKQNKLFFQRSNPGVEIDYLDLATSFVESTFVAGITDTEKLRLYIDYLNPISTDMELNFVKYQIDDGNGDLELMQRFFYNFWYDRDPAAPETGWLNYLSNVELVNEQFGAPGKKGIRGYKTDMGRVYLKYGPPNTITDVPFDASTSGMTVDDNPDAVADGGSVPYQIWHYYTLGNQRNRKFVFANIHLALFDYKLIHSNMPGEINNENWQAELRWRFQHDATMSDRDRYRGRSGDFYNNPR